MLKSFLYFSLLVLLTSTNINFNIMHMFALCGWQLRASVNKQKQRAMREKHQLAQHQVKETLIFSKWFIVCYLNMSNQMSKRGQILGKVCLYILRAPYYNGYHFIIVRPAISWCRCRVRSHILVFHSITQATMGWFVCRVCLSSVSAHMWEIPHVCLGSPLNIAFRCETGCNMVESRACVHAVHGPAVRVTCVKSFSKPWIRVTPSNLRECLFTHQTEGERVESEETCVKERQSVGSQCFDKVSECR